MKQKVKMGSRLDANLEALRSLASRVAIKSKWNWEHWRAGKMIDSWVEENVVTDEGLDALLDIMFSSGTQITAWYIALFEDDYTPDGSETYAVPGFTETTAYDETNRPAWTEAGVSSQQITNSASKATFTFNATKSIYGGALVGGGTDPDTKDDQAGGGTMYCVSAFSGGAKAVESTDVLKITVTLTAQDV